MRGLLLFFSLIIFYNSPAQQYDSLVKGSIKIDFFNFIDEFPATMVSYEHQLSPDFYMHHEVGVVIPTENFMGKVSGFKLREEIRTYFPSGKKTDFYVGIDALYTQERIKDNVVLGYQCSSDWWFSECQYYKNDNGIYRKELLAFSIRPGMRHNFNSFFFEYDFGISYGRDNVSIRQVIVPPGYKLIESNPFNLLLNPGLKILPTVRGKVGIYLYKKPHQKI